MAPAITVTLFLTIIPMRGEILPYVPSGSFILNPRLNTICSFGEIVIYSQLNKSYPADPLVALAGVTASFSFSFTTSFLFGHDIISFLVFVTGSRGTMVVIYFLYPALFSAALPGGGLSDVNWVSSKPCPLNLTILTRPLFLSIHLHFSNVPAFLRNIPS